MNCSNCDGALDDGATLCGSCGAAQSPITSPYGPQAINPKSKSEIKESPANKVWTTVRILLVIAWSLFIASHGTFSAYSAGYALGMLVIPFIVAYAITRKERGWFRFSYWFLALGIILPVLSAPKSLSNLPHSDLLKEMAGTEKVDSGLSVRDQKTLSVTRAIFSDLRENRKLYNNRAAALTPDLQWLFSNESFTSRANIKKALNIIGQMTTLDHENFAFTENLSDLVKSRLDQSDLSEHDRRDFLKGFLSKFNGSKVLTSAKNLNVAEQAWVDATENLYKYAYLHVDEIHIENGQLAIRSDRTRGQFNARLQRSQELREDFVSAEKKFDAAQKESLREQGVTAADLGVPGN